MEKENRQFEKREKLLLRPSVIILSGAPLSGKTYLAERLADSSNLKIIDVDTIRNEVDETRKKDGQIRLLEPDKEREVMVRSYTEMCSRAEEMVNSGTPTLVIGTFSRSEFKQPLERLVTNLKERGIAFKIFLLTAPDEEVAKRIEKRKTGGSLSNIDSLDKYRWAKGFFKKIEFAPVMEIDTAKPDSVDKVSENLKDLALKL